MKLTLFCTVMVMFCCFGSVFSQNYDKFKQHSIYTDFKAKAVGDIVTILVVESTTGSGQSDNKAADDATVKADGSVTGNLTKFLPILGATSKFSSDNKAKSSSAQKDDLTGKLTAVVTRILPNGNLVLQGRRKLEVSGETYVLEVRGVARQKDISSDNILNSYNLANVQIKYKKDGFINKLGKPGLITRWTTWLMLAGLSASAYFSLTRN